MTRSIALALGVLVAVGLAILPTTVSAGECPCDTKWGATCSNFDQQTQTCLSWQVIPPGQIPQICSAPPPQCGCETRLINEHCIINPCQNQSCKLYVWGCANESFSEGTFGLTCVLSGPSEEELVLMAAALALVLAWSVVRWTRSRQSAALAS